MTICLPPLKRKVLIITNTLNGQLGHILDDERRVRGWWSWIIRHPRLDDPAGVDHSPTCVQVAYYTVDRPSRSTATLRFSLLPHWWFWVVFLSCNP